MVIAVAAAGAIMATFLLIAGLRKEKDEPLIGPGEPAVGIDLSAIMPFVIILGGIYLLSRK